MHELFILRFGIVIHFGDGDTVDIEILIAKDAK